MPEAELREEREVEERQVPSAVADLSRQVARVDEAVGALYERLALVLSESEIPGERDVVRAVGPSSDVPLAQTIIAERDRLEAIERLLRELHRRVGV